MKKVGDHTWYDEDEIKLDAPEKEPGYSSDEKGCGKQVANILLVVLTLGVLLAKAIAELI